MQPDIPFKRILLKLSGEALKGKSADLIDKDVITQICGEIKHIHSSGIEIAVVSGGGNIIRGIHSGKVGINRITADYMGMLATMINGLALQDLLIKIGIPTTLFSALGIEEIAEPFNKRKVIDELAKKRIVVFTAGTGNPFFSTDTAAALRAIEINADILLKATNVEGVFTADPKKDPKAVKLKTLTYSEFITRRLQALDLTAVTLCAQHKLPIKLFNITKKGNIIKSLTQNIGTIIK